LLISHPRSADVPPTGEPSSDINRNSAILVRSVVIDVRFVLLADETYKDDELPYGLSKPIAWVEYKDDV
jgi:hypothetical protein